MASQTDELRCAMWEWLHLPLGLLVTEINYSEMPGDAKLEAIKAKCVEMWPERAGLFEDLFASIVRHGIRDEVLRCCDAALNRQ